MNTYYRKFLSYKISLEPYGIYPWMPDDEPYFCTPKYAELIGRTGVDGIHYCFVKGYGEAVFAVSPCNAPGEYLHPVARNFEEFLSLLIACKGEAALEQGWMWDEDTFNRFVDEQECTPEMEKTKQQLVEKLQVQPEYLPWKCLKEVRAEIDCSKIKPCKKMPVLEPKAPEEWQVKFEDKGKPGWEIPLGTSFRWADRDWLIPSVYRCAKGLVIDFCRKIPEKQVQEYFDKWNLMNEDENHFTDAEMEQINNENPIEFAFHAVAEVNGKKLDWSHGNGFWYSSLSGEAQNTDSDSEAWMNHYQLDRSCCWSFARYHFPWATKRKPDINELWVELEQDEISCSGEPFTVSGPNEIVNITHPVTGKAYTLKVLDLQPETLSEQQLFEGFICPKYLWTIRYTLDPELPHNDFSLRDCDESDMAIRAQEEKQSTCDSSVEVAALGIIGGADGPTAVIVTRIDKNANERSDCSSLHFEPVSKVVWKPVFQVKQFKNIRICLG